MTTVNKYRLFCETENAYVYAWNTTEQTVCPNNSGHTIDTDSITIVDSISEEQASLVSAANSSALALQSAASFEGTYEQVDKYSSISVFGVLGAQETATLEVSFSADENGTHTRTKSTVIGTNASDVHTFTVVSKYVKVAVRANRGSAANGHIQVIYHKFKSKNLTTGLAETLTNYNCAQLSRSVVTGALDGGDYRNVSVSSVSTKANALDVCITKPLTAFGEMMTSTLTPILQAGNAYEELNDQLFQSLTYDPANLARSSVYSCNSMVTVECAPTSNAYCISNTRNIMMYRPGQGVITRFSGLFPNGGILNSYQLMGYGTEFNGIYIGYSGSNFGVVRRRGGEPAIYKLDVSTAPTSSGNCTLTLNSIAYTIAVTPSASNDITFAAYEIAENNTFRDANNNETLWYPYSHSNSVFFTAVKDGVRGGTYSFNAGTTGMSVTGNAPYMVHSGAEYTEFFTPQASFNIDTLDGEGPSGFQIDPSKGNVYEIQLQWLGFGAMTFSVEDTTGRIIPFHRMHYQNSNLIPSLAVPHAPIRFITEVSPNTNAVTNPKIQYAAIYAAIEGTPVYRLPKYSIANTIALVGRTERNVIVLHGRRNFNAQANYTVANFTSVSLAVTSGQSAVKFRVYINPTLSPNYTATDFPRFQQINESSAILYDTNSKTLSNGIVVLQFVVSRDSVTTINAQELNTLVLNGSEVFAITAQGENNTVDVSLTWVEDH